MFSKHHVGGRNGRGGFPAVPKLHGSIACTMYEADPSCISAIEEELLLQEYGKVEVIPACLGGSNNVRNFNVNHDGYTSSLLPLNEKYANFYQQHSFIDYNYNYVMAPAKELQILTATLDSIGDKLPVDFLSLDTQGSELEILRGSMGALKNSVGVETEVSFRQIYKDTALFGEINSFLTGLGFEFIGFTSLTFDAPRTMSRLHRCRKLLSFGDALFLKIPDTQMEENQKKKLVFAALSYGQIEYAQYCVKQLNLNSPILFSPGSKFIIENWIDFVDYFISICGLELPDTPKYSDIYDVNIDDKTTLEKKLLRKFASLVRICKQRSVFKFYNLTVRKLVPTRPSQLERLYESVGLSNVAKELKLSRLNIKMPPSYLRL